MPAFDVSTGDFVTALVTGLMITSGLVLICVGHLIERRKRSRS